MPWFCASVNKKHNKTKVENISQSKDDTLLTNGQPTFTVALQNFDASVCDELSSQRGQVLEALYTDGEWIYVRNVNGKCGYIPESFCYPLDATNGSSFQKNVVDSPQQRPRPKSLHLDIAPTTEEGSLSSVGLHQQVRRRSHDQVDPLLPRTSTPITPRTATPATPNTTLSFPSASPNPDTHINLGHRRTCSSAIERYQVNLGQSDNMRNRSTGKLVIHNTSSLDVECNIEAQANPAVEQATCTSPHVVSTSSAALLSTPDSILSHNSTLSHPSPPLVKRAENQRRRSCVSEHLVHETTHILPANKHTCVSTAITKPKGVRRGVSMNEGAHCKATLEMRTNVPPVQRSMSYQEAVLSTMEKLNQNPQRRLSSKDSPGCSRKNCDCSRPRRFPRRLRDTERHGNSAVCYDSDDVFLPETESKKPYGIYRCRQDYEPKFKGEIALSRNELVIVLDYGRGEWAWIITSNHIEGLIPKQLLVRYNGNRGASRNRSTDATTQTELVVTGTVRQVSSASSACGGQSIGSSPTEEGSQESTQSEGAAITVVASASVQTDGSPEWFKFGDSLERPSQTSTCSTPASISNLRGHEMIQHVNKGGCANRSKPDSQRKHETAQCQQGTPVLAAASDYEPPTNSKNCLALKKGDVLTPQTHMYFPKGWMWVWHTGLRTFGYVPNSCVLYTYCVPKTSRRRTDTIEDAV